MQMWNCLHFLIFTKIWKVTTDFFEIAFNSYLIFMATPCPQFLEVHTDSESVFKLHKENVLKLH